MVVSQWGLDSKNNQGKTGPGHSGGQPVEQPRAEGSPLTLACSCAHLDRCPRTSTVSADSHSGGHNSGIEGYWSLWANRECLSSRCPVSLSRSHLSLTHSLALESLGPGVFFFFLRMSGPWSACTSAQSRVGPGFVCRVWEFRSVLSVMTERGAYLSRSHLSLTTTKKGRLTLCW